MASDTAPVILAIPTDSDASALGVMHLLSWQQTYPSAEHAIDAEWISEHIGFMASPAADDFRRRLFSAQRANPSSTYYRLARQGDRVVGFVHSSRTVDDDASEEQTSANSSPDSGVVRPDARLEALYLLREHHGTGLADEMMAGALDWLAGQAVRLEVASYNARAIGFYQRYGFQPTGQTSVFRDRVPTLEMRRGEEQPVWTTTAPARR